MQSFAYIVKRCISSILGVRMSSLRWPIRTAYTWERFVISAIPVTLMWIRNHVWHGILVCLVKWHSAYMLVPKSMPQRTVSQCLLLRYSLWHREQWHSACYYPIEIPHTIEHWSIKIIKQIYWEGNKSTGVLRCSAVRRRISVPLRFKNTACE